jgi:hypothetical protein
MQVGDLIKWVDYKPDNPVTKVGLFIKKEKIKVDAVTMNWGDILVLCDGQYVKWTSWQCEKISK